MIPKLHVTIAAVAVSLSIACAACAGPVLDDILNAMQLDQQTSASTEDYLYIERDKPIGQTFVTGDSVERLCRIAIKVAYWHDDWQPGETLVLTVWDSPAKKTSVGSFGVPYERRQWDRNIMMFSVEAPVEPNREYYFELTVDGGDGRLVGIFLAKDDYAAGRGYDGNEPLERDIWFETHVKKTADRDANLAVFFDNFDLDYPGLEKVSAAVGAKDWDTACSEFLIYIEARENLLPEIDANPKLDPSFDTTEADLVADQKWPAQDGTVVDLGPNWNYFASWPTLGGVGLTRTGLMKPLAFTYTKTGDEKYARAWNDMLISTFRNVPCPTKSGVVLAEGRIGPLVPAGISGTLWDSISIAARIHHETFYNRFRKSPLFEPDVRMAWWANLVDMANLLERMDAGGNWTTQNVTSLFSLGEKYPELKKSKQWFAQGFEGMKENLLDNVYEDGPLREATTGYHAFSVGMFHNTFLRAREQGLEIPEEHLDRLEKSFEYMMYSAQPDWHLPIWGDTNRIHDPTGLLAHGARFFNRDDMLWVATKGQEGREPEKGSVEFPIAGYYIMRSKWGTDGKFLVTRNGWSNSHYHSDQLSVIVNAYGTDLLPDPGVYTYGTPEMNELVRTKAHSTISVNGNDILSGSAANTWWSLRGLDYFDGASPGYQNVKDVTHQRSILFVKPDYWVIADRVNGPGEHTASQYWRFAPGEVEFDPATGSARTTNTTGGNLAVIPLYAEGRTGELADDWYAIDWTNIDRAPVVKHERSGSLPLTFCTVLFPYPAGQVQDIRARDLICDDSSLRTQVLGTRIGHGSYVDYVMFNSTKQMASADNGKLRAAAKAAFVRTSTDGWKVTAFGWASGKELWFGNTRLAVSDLQCPALSVSYSEGSVTVHADVPDRSLQIATLGARKAVANGKQITLPAGAQMFQPYPDL